MTFKSRLTARRYRRTLMLQHGPVSYVAIPTSFLNFTLSNIGYTDLYIQGCVMRGVVLLHRREKQEHVVEIIANVKRAETDYTQELKSIVHVKQVTSASIKLNRLFIEVQTNH